jgi:SRSO17 transposase
LSAWLGRGRCLPWDHFGVISGQEGRRDLPDGAVTREDLAVWDEEFRKVVARIGPLFRRSESRAHAERYLRGLLLPLERKNGWTIAEHTGEREPKALQRFLNLTPWDADELRDVVLEYAVENFADPRGVLIADPTGFAKKGTKSAGVQRQYSGTLGRIDNCQIGSFLAYADTAGDRVLVDRELYVPETTWFGDRGRCAEAGIPEDATFATRPQQVREMIGRVRAAGLPFAWFTADEEFGQNPGLREYLEAEGIAYVMAVPKSTVFTGAAGEQTVISDVPTRLKPNDWQRRACGIGTKGFRVYDWALVNSAEPDHQYMIRRSVDDGELAFYHCHNPRREGFGELVRAAGSRWPVEECFSAGKSEVGLDNYQVRLYHAWYRHITMSMLALAFLAVIRRAARKGTRGLWTTLGDRQNKHPVQA